MPATKPRPEATIEQLETYFPDQINARCGMPGIGRQDAFDLWYAGTELVRSINNFRRLARKLSTPQMAKFVKKLASESFLHHTVGRLANHVVRSALTGKPTRALRKAK